MLLRTRGVDVTRVTTQQKYTIHLMSFLSRLLLLCYLQTSVHSSLDEIITLIIFYNKFAVMLIRIDG